MAFYEKEATSIESKETMVQLSYGEAFSVSEDVTDLTAMLIGEEELATGVVYDGN